MATSMQAMIYEFALENSAQKQANKCTNIASDIQERSQDYFNDNLRTNNVDSNVRIGETIFISDTFTSYEDILIRAISQWTTNCQNYRIDIFQCIPNQNCDDCLQFITDRVRYIGIGFNMCNNQVNVYAHYYQYIYDITTPFPKPFFAGGSIGCNSLSCPSDRNICDDTDPNRSTFNMCIGCPSKNFERCSNYINSRTLCIVEEPLNNCVETGIYNIDGYNDNRANNIDILRYINAQRSNIARGNNISPIVITTDNITPITPINMESVIWEDGLANMAQNKATQCEGFYDDRVTLSNQYILNSVDTIVSNDSNKVFVSQTIVTLNPTEIDLDNGWINEFQALQRSIDTMIDDCRNNFRYNTMTFQHICLDDDNECRLCLQILSASSRYVGCNLNLCGLITDENGASQSLFNTLFICNWYWGAQPNVDVPQTIPVYPFAILPNNIGCTSNGCVNIISNQWDRNVCDSILFGGTGLCIGSYYTNFFKCHPNFGDDNCQFNNRVNGDGVTPTQTPTISPTIDIGIIDKITLINEANRIRSRIALGTSGIQNILKATNMERLIWNDALQRTAKCSSTTCDNVLLRTNEISNQFRDINDDSINTLSDNINRINVQEIKKIYPVERPKMATDYGLQLINDAWNECINNGFAFFRCNSDCSNCIKLIWANTRFIGIDMTVCDNSFVTVVAHFYYGADIQAWNEGRSAPYVPGNVCLCNNPNRLRRCEPGSGLCEGCPLNDWEKCNFPDNSECTAIISPTLCPVFRSGNLPPTTIVFDDECPTLAPTIIPTHEPTNIPTTSPTLGPTTTPTNTPTENPSLTPTITPTVPPTSSPTLQPTARIVLPQIVPTDPNTNGNGNDDDNEGDTPSQKPSISPTNKITTNPTTFPTTTPTKYPTNTPSMRPTNVPSTGFPSELPTNFPSMSPTISPFPSPTNNPTLVTSIPTKAPTPFPTNTPTVPPTSSPTLQPTAPPTLQPTARIVLPQIVPTDPNTNGNGNDDDNEGDTPSQKPSISPTNKITTNPTTFPTTTPTKYPTNTPSMRPTNVPSTGFPSELPTTFPSMSPTISPFPSPTNNPTLVTSIPTKAPTSFPTNTPTLSPLLPTFPTTYKPSLKPSIAPSIRPSLNPTIGPTLRPSENPSQKPSKYVDSTRILISHNACLDAQHPNPYMPIFFPFEGEIDYVEFSHNSGYLKYNYIWGISLNGFQVHTLFLTEYVNKYLKNRILIPNNDINGYATSSRCTRLQINDNRYYCLKSQSITSNVLKFNLTYPMHVDPSKKYRVILGFNLYDKTSIIYDKICFKINAHYVGGTVGIVVGDTIGVVVGGIIGDTVGDSVIGVLVGLLLGFGVGN